MIESVIELWRNSMSIFENGGLLCTEKYVAQPLRTVHTSMFCDSINATPDALNKSITYDISDDDVNKTDLDAIPSITDTDDDQTSHIEFFLVDSLSDTNESTNDQAQLVDDFDSAYGSLDAEEGNLPKLDLLTDKQLYVQGRGLSVSDYCCTVSTNDKSSIPPNQLIDQSDERVHRAGNQPVSTVTSATVTSLNISGITENKTFTRDRAENKQGAGEDIAYTPGDILQEELQPLLDTFYADANTLEELAEAGAGGILPKDNNTETIKIRSVDSCQSTTVPQSQERLEFRNTAFDLENFESNVNKAYEDSIRSDSLAPLIKEELKCLIQCRRLQSGKPEIFLEPERPKEYQLSGEEIMKRNKRLQQNRKSAKKSRQISREKEIAVIKYVEKSEGAKTQLSNELKKLRQTRNSFLARLKQHLATCRNPELVARHTRLLKLMGM